MSSPTLQFPSLDAALAKFENANPAYNNPGAIQAGYFASRMGATGTTPNGLATFPSFEAGQTAEDTLIQHYSDAGLDLNSLVAKWSGLPEGQNLTNYQNSVAADTGASGSTPVSSMAAPDCSGLKSLTWDCFSGNAYKKSAPTSTAASAGGTLIGRLAAGIVGLLLIGAGLFMFRGGEAPTIVIDKALGAR